MNLLSTARLLANITLLILVAAILVFAMSGGPMQPNVLLVLGGVALFGGLVQFLVSALKPETIRPTWDEQNVASHRGAYQFGYWAALIGFWVVFAVNHWLAVDLESAFLWMGVILVSAPSAWMAMATILGRAG